MTVGRLGRVALVAALVWLVAAASAPRSAAAGGARPDPGDLTLGGAAGSVLVGLTLRPAEPGDVAVLVHLEPPGGAEPWGTRSGPRLEVPSHIWDFPDPVAVRVVGDDRVDGVDTTVVAFFVEVGDRAVWYRLWVDAEGLVHSAQMRTRGHFMDHRYHRFDEPVTIAPPYGPVARAAVALLGDPPRAYWEATAAGVRWVVQTGSLGAAGGAAFLMFVHDRRRDELAPLARLVAAAGLTAAAGTVLGVPLQAAAATGDVAAMVDPEALGTVLVSRSGLAALLRLGGLVALVAVLPRLWAPSATRVAVTAGLIALGSFALTGHTATAEPRVVAAAANLAHLAVAAVWFGGLALLGGVLRRRHHDGDAPGAAALVARFSTLALAGVGVLTVVGAALAWTVVPSLAALPASVYGRTLLTKLTVVAAVVAVAAYNRLRLLPAVVRGGDGALITLRRTVRLEAAGLLAALAVTALLVNVSPPRPGPGSSTTPTATSTAANHEAPPSTPIPAAHRRGVG